MESEFRLVMISAMYENGGNTMHRMLDGHPRLFVYPFESQVGTGAALDFLSSYVPVRYRWPEFTTSISAEEAYEMFWDEELKTLLRGPSRSKFRECGLHMDEAERKRAFVDFLAGRDLTRANIVEAFFRSTFSAWQNEKVSGRETAYVGYSPVLVFDTEKVFSDFPDAHIIHVVRNPYSGFAETLKRPFPLSLYRYVWTWNLCQHMAMTFSEKYCSNFHICRFEDLIGDPNSTMKKICEHIDIPFSETCLYPSFNGVRLEKVYPWGTIRTPTAAADLATMNSLTSSWKREIKAQAIVMIQMNMLG